MKGKLTNCGRIIGNHFIFAQDTLWRHNALLFGSTGAVWSYGRTSDLCWLFRCLLATPCLHYVDDFGGLEDDEEALDVFTKMHEIGSMLGFQFKESKKQAPAKERKIQGVIMTLENGA